MSDHAGLVRVGRFRPAAGKRDDVAAVLGEMAATARRADGCFGAQVTISNRDHESIVLVSRWQSRGALDRFGTTSEFEAVRSRLQPLLEGPPEFELFTTA